MSASEKKAVVEPPETPPVIPLEEREAFRTRLHLVEAHVDGVRRAGVKLANRLIDVGKLDLARRLSQRCHDHDSSKWEGIEWEFLTLPSEVVEKDDLKSAIRNHQEGNDHHPEFFTEGVKGMNDEQIAEMVCDWQARSSEKGTNLREWIKEEATVKYGFSLKTKVYQRIKYFVDLLLDPPFKS